MIDSPAEMLELTVIGAGCVLLLLTAWFAWVSRREEEPRAARLAALFAFLLPLPFLAAGLVDSAFQTALCLALLGVTVLVPVILLLPFGNKFPPEDDKPQARVDERDIMFSRNSLEAGSDRFNDYYARNPERKAPDDLFRSHPGLMRDGSTYYDPITAAAAKAAFRTVAALHRMQDVEKLPATPRVVNPARMTRFIKRWTRELGAVSVGVTTLRDYHLYSTIGRGERYGEPVEVDHRNAVALTVEMDKSMMDRAPQGPTVMESARQYLNSGVLAIQLADFIRRLGYSARAHIDGSYRVICPLVARDAGLGEIGRMGILMTPELGPRVRIAVVTTDLPLVHDERKRDDTMIDFCRRCMKCADACPSRAIPFDDRRMIDGVSRWQIDSEACFTLWCRIGTDCGRCMSVCPYSHPNNTIHNMMRFGVKQSALFREAALKLDDIFYGRHPRPLEVPGWIGGIVEDEVKEKRAGSDA